MKKDFWKSLFWEGRANPFLPGRSNSPPAAPAVQDVLPEGHRGMARKDMSLEDFGKILPHLREVENVVLEGWGVSPPSPAGRHHPARQE